MKNQQENEPKNNKPNSRKKSILSMLLIFVALITFAVLLAPGCSPVSLEVKFWGVELLLQKG